MILFSLRKFPEVELLGYIVFSLLILSGTTVQFTIIVAPVYIPSTKVQGVSFSPHPHQPLLVLVFSDTSHSDWGEVICHHRFDLHFPEV